MSDEVSVVLQYLVVAIVAYLLGSIPFGYLLMKTFRGVDIRSTGSGNIGATNVARSAPSLGILTLALDMSKGFLAVLAGCALGQALSPAAAMPQGASWFEYLFSESARAYPWGAAAAFFAVLGHIFPVWLRFRGGKGVATAVGGFVALAPKSIAVVLLIFLVVVLAFRYISLGSIVAVALFPVFAYLFYGVETSGGTLAAFCAASLLIIARHYQNIRRLLAGTEARFHLKRSRA
ncbi:MAG TPA: glycerol-3-phosphate 1-O-acyltransferase PlsY [Terriglobales bacterium]|jgi:glycerol-3-phosphate acyltransferase PlsY|nr:glycerol-3-phosphate 1-O-acyltransferase PlsY [Terriglobales bacterium]